MSQSSHLRGNTRRSPSQQRGRKRVARLLDAAIAAFAASGYEATTMSDIAKRARSPIGSLYQFFPNKQAVARTLRSRQVDDLEQLWVALQGEAKDHTLASFVAHYVQSMTEFVRGH